MNALEAIIAAHRSCRWIDANVVDVGRYAMTAIGSAVHRDALDYALVAGNPARRVGWVCACGAGLSEDLTCAACSTTYQKTTAGLRAAGQPAPSESTHREN